VESPKASTDHLEIEVYAEGSYNQELRLGAWAFNIPKLKLEGVGSSEGKTAASFEFLAVLNGLEAVLAAEGSRAPIRIFSDCESTVSAIDRLSAGLGLRKPEKYADRADLMPHLEAVLARRRVHVTRVGVGPVEHQDCHRNALRKLRQELATDGTARPDRASAPVAGRGSEGGAGHGQRARFHVLAYLGVGCPPLGHKRAGSAESGHHPCGSVTLFDPQWRLPHF
jgi:ribonuclease HI